MLVPSAAGSCTVPVRSTPLPISLGRIQLFAVRLLLLMAGLRTLPSFALTNTNSMSCPVRGWLGACTYKDMVQARVAGAGAATGLVAEVQGVANV